MSKRSKCERCDGSGGKPYGEVGCCRTCNGAGWVTKEETMDFKKEYGTLDSGNREDFPSGMRRDTQDGKPRYDLIPVGPLMRVALLMERGAKKYGDRNWEKGQPLSRAYSSLLRHIYQWASGDSKEDHLAAVVFNAFAIMFYEERIAEGSLGDELADIGPQKKLLKHNQASERERACLRKLREAFAKHQVAGECGQPKTYQPPDEGIKKMVEESQRWALLRPFVVDASAQFTYWPCPLFLATMAGLKDESGWSS